MKNKKNKKTKVFWTKMWPNNGFGWLLFRTPVLNIYIVKDYLHGIVFCRKVEELQKAINDKKEQISDFLIHGGSDNIRLIVDEYRLDVNLMEKFLTEVQ